MEIGSEPAAGRPGTKAYPCKDGQPLDGAVYYRLKMLGINGKYNYSKMVTIKKSGILYGSSQPNPFIQTVTASFSLPEAGKVRITLTGARGLLVNRGEWKGGEGRQYDLLNSLQGHPGGMYLLRVEANGTVLQ